MTAQASRRAQRATQRAHRAQRQKKRRRRKSGAAPQSPSQTSSPPSSERSSPLTPELPSQSPSRSATRAALSDPPAIPDGDQLLDLLPHPVLLLDGANRILRANAAAEHFFHASIAQLTRRRLDDLVAFSSPLLALVDQARRSESSLNEYGVDLAMTREGMPRPTDIHARLVEPCAGLVLVMLQERAIARMIERQLVHRGAARSVSALASVLAHEIKNPLSGIRGAAQLIEAGLDEEGRALTRLICSETDRICELVDRMETFGEEAPIAGEPVNVHSVLDHVKRLAESGFASHIRFEEDYDPSLPEVLGDHDRLVQALLNLVKNAAEAIGPERKDGRIVLRTAFRPGVRLTAPGSASSSNLALLIAVEDNGPGVADAVRERLFDPFVTSKAKGSGLGLALVAKIVGDHGGIIEHKAIAQGTVFQILLPLNASRAGTNGKTKREKTRPMDGGNDADAELEEG